MTGPRPVRLAVLGTGAIAQVVHLPMLAKMADAELVGVVDLDEAKAATLAARFDAPRVYRSADDVWNDDGVDGVVICTPNHLHEEQVLQALDAAKYVFCEKPLALTAAGAGRILGHPASGRLMVGMNQRFRPDAEALRAAVGAGQLGQVQYVKAGWLNRRLGRSGPGWRHRRELSGGGALMDLGLQLLDLALWILRYPKPVRLVAHLRGAPGAEVEDTAILLLELDGGTLINLEVTWSLVSDRERQYIEVIGTEGSASFAPLRIFQETEDGVRDAAPVSPPPEENPFTASYRAELIHFVRAVREARPLPSLDDQATLMTLLDAAYRSAHHSAEIIF